MLKLVARLVLALSGIACCTEAMAQVIVKDPWVRGTIEGQTATGAYMTLTSVRSVVLVSVSSGSASHAAVHEMRMHGNMMTMRSVDRLAVPAGQAVALDEGHYHVMLEGLKGPLKAGGKVGLDLTFVDSSGARQVVRVSAEVRGLAGREPGTMHSQMGHE
jgi:copper(I)-binding protein